MRNSEAYDAGYQLGQGLAYLTLAGVVFGIYFLVKYLRKRREKSNQNDPLDKI